MRDLDHVKKVESMIKEIKAMDLSLPEKMYYVYTLFLEDLTEELKDELRYDITKRHEIAELMKKGDEKSLKKAEKLGKELFLRDKEKAKKLPDLVTRIKAEVSEYADHFEVGKWQKEEEEKRAKEKETIAKIQKHIKK